MTEVSSLKFLVNENQPLSDGNIFQDQIKSKLVAES